MESLFIFFIILLTAWFGVSVLYMLIYSITGLFYKNKKFKLQPELPSIAVLIPAYKEDAVIIHVAEEALTQNYKGNFEVFIIADSLQAITLKKLDQLPINLIEVRFEKSTKAKALNLTMSKIKSQFDMAVVLDADNIMENDVLAIMANHYQKGFMAMQGHRCAKNKDTRFAFIDAISEEVNNHIYSKGPSVLKLSSRLAGSGMAFDYQLFKRLMKTIDAVGGFDKELELKIIKEGITIQYLDSAIVYDEKVSQSEVYAKQRTRWISAQYNYMIKTMPDAFLQLFKGKFDYFYKAFQLTLPPRLLLPGLLFIGSILLAVLGYYSMASIWVSIFIANVIAYSVAIPAKLWTKDIWSGFLALPQAFFLTFKLMFKLGGADKKFIHTPHTYPNKK